MALRTAPTLSDILPKGTIVKVSSTLDNASGKGNLLDGSNETCWSSQQGLPQSVQLIFPKLVPATHIAITFQGGFSGTTAAIYLSSAPRPKEVDHRDVMPLGLVFAGRIYPKDGNARQVFEIPYPDAIVSPTSPTRKNNRMRSSLSSFNTGSSSSLPPSPVVAQGSHGSGGVGALNRSTTSVDTVDPEDERDFVKEIKIEFEKGADPWGRIVVYEIELLG